MATRSKIQVGVSPFGSSRQVVLDLARGASDAGLDGLILGDGFVSTPSFPIWSGGVDCFVELAWLAGKVEMPTYGMRSSCRVGIRACSPSKRRR